MCLVGPAWFSGSRSRETVSQATPTALDSLHISIYEIAGTLVGSHFIPVTIIYICIMFYGGAFDVGLAGVYSVRLLTRTTSLQRGPLEASIAPVACS